MTVAVRGRLETSAISPKKSPAPIVFTLRPLRRTSAVALDQDEELAAGIALGRQHLALGHVDLVGDEGHLPSSLFEQWAKSGARLRSSILASRRSTARV